MAKNPGKTVDEHKVQEPDSAWANRLLDEIKKSLDAGEPSLDVTLMVEQSNVNVDEIQQLELILNSSTIDLMFKRQVMLRLLAYDCQKVERLLDVDRDNVCYLAAELKLKNLLMTLSVQFHHFETNKHQLSHNERCECQRLCRNEIEHTQRAVVGVTSSMRGLDDLKGRLKKLHLLLEDISPTSELRNQGLFGATLTARDVDEGLETKHEP